MFLFSLMFETKYILFQDVTEISTSEYEIYDCDHITSYGNEWITNVFTIKNLFFN